MIVLVRCDDRLIHGQFITVITKEYDANNVIVVDDFTASNPLLKTVFSAAVPKNMKAAVYSIEDSINKIEEASIDNTNTIVLLKDPKVFYELLTKTDKLPKTLNIGPMSNRKGTKAATRTTHLLEDEIEAINKSIDFGAEIYIRQVPAEKKTEWDEVKKLL